MSRFSAVGRSTMRDVVVRWVAAVVCLALATAPVWGQGTETSKIFTEDAPTGDTGSTEAQLTYLHGVRKGVLGESGGGSQSERAEVRHLALTVTHGLGNTVDFTASLLGTDVLRDGSGEYAEGFRSLQLNLKWRIFEFRSSGVSLSWLPGVYIPLARPEATAPGQEYWSLGNLLAMTWVAGNFNLSGDAGFELAIGSDRSGQLWAAVADVGCGYQVTPWFQPLAELNLFYAEVGG